MDNAIYGSAKAWAQFNGTTSPATIRSSYNVSSVTKNGTGDYTVNMTNALADANFACFVTGTYGACTSFNNYTPTTTTARIQTFNTTTAANQDTTYISVGMFR